MSQRTLNIGDRLGHYRLIEKIGAGGQGEVWRACDERFDRDVALKILTSRVFVDDSARERFRQEARAVGKLNHPNIATAHDFGNDPVDYLVTEYVSGASLDQKLAAGAMPEETVLTLGMQLASGLEAAHRAGIIHRDLKPGNLRITRDGHLKILDFGLAEIVDPGKDIASAETITINLTLTGTVPYMAPEQFDGIYDRRTDLWSVGAVLYEMATGHLPFTETALQPLKNAIQRKAPIRPSAIIPAISPGLEAVILRCLEKNPIRRYQTATDLREDLARVARGQKTREDEKLQGKRFALAALVVVLAASTLTAIYYWPQIRKRLWPDSQEVRGRFRLMAILPIESTGRDASDDALVRGMAETVSARIAQETDGQKLQLIPPSELISRGAKTTDAAQREFGVERVLEVSVQRSGDKVRVTCSLIDSRTHQLVRACTVTGDSADLFALQDKLVGEVVAMLPRDTRNEQAEPSEVLAAAPAAYEFYLKGRGYLLDYQKAENIDAAIKQFEQALKTSPNYAPAYAGLGEAYWHGHKADRGKDWLDKAKVNCEKALGADPKMAEGHVCLGNLYNDTGKYQEASGEFQRALALDPQSAEALNGLGEAYDRLGNAAAAEETYKKAIAVRPQYWAVYNWLGSFYYGQARYEDAAAMFRKVVELTPDNHRGYYNLGAIYLLEGKYNEANAALNRAIQLQPTLSAYSNLGESYFFSHRFAEAAAMCEKARTLDDKDYLNWGNLAEALYWTPGRREESFPVYKQAIELARADLQVNPRDASALAYLAVYSAVLGDNRAASASLQKALDLAPTDPDIMYRAALVYNRLGDEPAALDWLKKAISARFSRTIVRDTPDFDHLQSAPAFTALITGG